MAKAELCAICGIIHEDDGRHVNAMHPNDGHSHTEHSHGESGCACGVSHEVSKNGWLLIALGAVLMLAAYFMGGVYSALMFAASYIILGGPVLMQAGRDLLSGRLFQESFLMGIATVGAFLLGEYSEAVAVMLFYRVGEHFQELAIDKSRRSIADIVSLRPEKARVMRGGVYIELDPGGVAVGETIAVYPGERIPLDGLVIAGESRVDTSALTGESVPMRACAGKELLAGFVNQSAPITLEVTKTLDFSASSRVLRAVEDAAEGKPKIENFISRFARVYTPIVVVIAVLVAFVPSLLGIGEFSTWAYKALMFLVISCPCALVLSVPLTFFAGLSASTKKGVLFKGANRMEALSRVKAVAFDKTGTLTHGVFKVTQVLPVDGVTQSELLSVAAAVETFSPHPIAKAIIEASEQPGARLEKYDAENPQEHAGLGVSAAIDGEKILAGNARFLEREGILLYKLYDGTVAYIARRGEYIGAIIIADEPKAKISETIMELKTKVDYTALVTGDTEYAAKDIAQKCGVDGCYYKLMPENKLEIIKDIRKRYGSVAFVGDGINDAPVLMGADIGIAIGTGGTDMAVEASDAVLLGNELSTLPDVIDISRRTMRIAYQNIVFALGTKTLVMALGLFGITSMWMAVFSDVGTALICVLNALRLLRGNKG